ncbi:MAG: methyltransferase domain-containing protein [Deltaproteobacteria bacterium]|nr:MAG: methyltransferase domain-containing protein [Deltaproteobacteria bacterium]
MKKNKIETKELGLLAALIFGKYFFDIEDLHLGYWTEDLGVNRNNFARAQENHSKLIISHIPENTKTILDIGCGAGTLATKLLNKGFSVDCVCPSPMLTEYAFEILGNRSTIFKCLFEEMESDKHYDTLVFSESFQYIELSTALRQSLNFLKQGGYLLICDFFKKDAIGKGPIGGGHRLSRFYDTISRYPFEPIEDIDITEQTAPNLALLQEALNSVGLPIRKLLFYYLDNNRPLISKLLKWRYRGKIEEFGKRCFSGEINAENYKKYNSYRLLLYRKKSS